MQKLAEVLALQRETPEEECIPGESVGCGEKISASAPPPPIFSIKQEARMEVPGGHGRGC